jgi:hypothetical protein
MITPSPTWATFQLEAPELAAFGEARLSSGRPSFLATVRHDALPRVHPVSASVKKGHLALYMYPSSPKGHDILKDGRIALHANVEDHDGSGGEFHLRGRGYLIVEPDETDVLRDAGFPPKSGYILVELEPEQAFGCTYPADGPPVIMRWRRSATVR